MEFSMNLNFLKYAQIISQMFIESLRLFRSIRNRKYDSRMRIVFCRIISFTYHISYDYNYMPKKNIIINYYKYKVCSR